MKLMWWIDEINALNWWYWCVKWMKLMRWIDAFDEYIEEISFKLVRVL